MKTFLILSGILAWAYVFVLAVPYVLELVIWVVDGKGRRR